ncbi:heavy metal-binding domain-containing protein, partial [Methylocystis sp.]|uniref:heavy metal-binding domain-containing protein n=1 Tax=Methylocystis sp. TaxID=1911079 RepID=UPI003D120451
MEHKHHHDHGSHEAAGHGRGQAHNDPPARQIAALDSNVTVASGTIYTCPMHPQIRQPAPGACPICGMTLEPVVATAETGPSHELVDMKRRFWIGLALA